MATVNVVTGTPSGKLPQNGLFDWINPNTTGGSCEVTGVSGWCTQSSYTVPQATGPNSPGTCTASTQNISGTFSFSSSCIPPGTPAPVIHVGSM